jgi:hypothetical protein
LNDESGAKTLLSLSVAIITKDEEANLPRLLDSLEPPQPAEVVRKTHLQSAQAGNIPSSDNRTAHKLCATTSTTPVL